MFDFHVHSYFSGDCKSPMETMVKQAIDKGVKMICFTDHKDEDYAYSEACQGICFEFNLAKQDALIRRLKQQYGDQIIILRGIELGVQPHILKSCDELVAEQRFDFVLASVHTAKRCNICRETFYQDRHGTEAFRDYLEDYYYCMKNLAKYQVAGHLDVIKRYHHKAANVDVLQFKQEIIEIFRVIIARGKGIEVNTGGYRYGLGDNNPSLALLKLYKACGGKIITIGSDAHRPEDIGYRYHETIDLLRTIGFRYVCTFQAQQVSYHRI